MKNKFLYTLLLFVLLNAWKKEEIDTQQYKELVKAMPKDVNWNDLEHFEEEDNTTGSQELACVGGACEIV